MSDDYSDVFQDCWWGAVATLTRMFGDLGAAEDAVQEACALAVEKWPATGVPANPRAWLTGTARHKALDRLRREAGRAEKEAAAMRELSRPEDAGDDDELALASAELAWASGHGADDELALVSADDELALVSADDELALVFMCCHPALDPAVRVALTLRCVCGLATAEIAAAFVAPEATIAQRLVRAKRKIKQAGIAFSVPARDDLPGRLGVVLRVIYLVFTAGHRAAHGSVLVRGDLCDQAIRLARGLTVLLPDEPEVTGLLALLLLTDARRAARVDPAGDLVLLADQDRGKWDHAKIREGEALLQRALLAGRPGAYQLHAAIAACHSCDETTDWHEVAALYGQLVRYEPTAVVQANRAVAVAMADGPAAGLAILESDELSTRLANWPQFHIARGELLRRLGRDADSADAYRTALRLEPPGPEQAFIQRQIKDLGG
ncbi:MAG: sigma-70 family RNA polymerase sigma factor [Streptosporangiaceae bacterium]|nr:sigma-70 family RNA polymerase sigma factor [Streptosporangiaceae bacterium]